VAVPDAIDNPRNAGSRRTRAGLLDAALAEWANHLARFHPRILAVARPWTVPAAADMLWALMSVDHDGRPAGAGHVPELLGGGEVVPGDLDRPVGFDPPYPHRHDWRQGPVKVS
jgi:hypothetical protein